MTDALPDIWETVGWVAEVIGKISEIVGWEEEVTNENLVTTVWVVTITVDETVDW